MTATHSALQAPGNASPVPAAPVTSAQVDAEGCAAIRHLAKLAQMFDAVGRPELAEGVWAVAVAVGGATAEVADDISIQAPAGHLN